MQLQSHSVIFNIKFSILLKTTLHSFSFALQAKPSSARNSQKKERKKALLKTFSGLFLFTYCLFPFSWFPSSLHQTETLFKTLFSQNNLCEESIRKQQAFLVTLHETFDIDQIIASSQYISIYAARMDTKQKKTLFGAIAALVLVVTIVLVVYVTNKPVDTLPSDDPKTTLKLTEDELLEEFKKVVRADNHKYITVEVQVEMKANGAAVHQSSEATQWALKAVWVHGSNEALLASGEAVDEDKMRKKISASDLIGKKMVVKEPVVKQLGTAKEQWEWRWDLKQLVDIFNVDEVTFLALQPSPHGRSLLHKLDGEDTVYYLHRKRSWR